MWFRNIAGRFFELVTKHACDRQTDGQTDGPTDGQNYDSQDGASIAASSGKNKTSAVAETGDRLNTIDMGQVCRAPFLRGRWVIGSPSNTMSLRPKPTSVPSGILIHLAL